MNLLADENILVDVVEWLRGAGHDVFSVREFIVVTDQKVRVRPIRRP